MNNTFHFVHIALKKKLHNMSGYKINKKKKSSTMVMCDAPRAPDLPNSTTNCSPIPPFCDPNTAQIHTQPIPPPLSFPAQKNPPQQKKKKKKKETQERGPQDK